MFENFPYTNFHDLNLDWLINRIMEAYGPDNPPPVGLVLSVNGETGAVVLYKNAIVRLPDIEESAWNIHRVADGSSSGIEFVKGQPAMRIDGVNRYKIYDEGNPPPGGGGSGAVDSVDGMTGVVKTWANTDNPTLNVPEESSGFLWDLRRGLSNGDQIGIEFEYDSVNQVYKTYLKYTPYQGTATRTELLTSASLPPSAGVMSVNGQTGVVTIYGDGIAIESGSQNSIKAVTDGLASRLTTAEGDIDDVEQDLSGVQTSLGNVQTSVSNLQSQVSGMNGSTIPIQANSQQTIKQYIDSQTPGAGGLTLRQVVYGDGVKTGAQLLSELKTTLDNMSEIELANARLVTAIDVLYLVTYNQSATPSKYVFSKTVSRDDTTLGYVVEVTELTISDSTYSTWSTTRTGGRTSGTSAPIPSGYTIKLYA